MKFPNWLNPAAGIYAIIVFLIILGLGCFVSPGQGMWDHLIDSFGLTLAAAGVVFAFAAIIV